jgi:hypothetical protein
MVTVIAAKEELTTPVNTSSNNNSSNGVASNDNERPFQYIKDYQEVDFRRSASCKPLPEDLFGTVDGQILKSSIKGTFFVQIDDIEPVTQVSSTNSEQPTTSEGGGSLIISITDGITNVKCVTLDDIPNLSLNTRIGSKLLLTGLISIQDGLLQLTHDNTRFRYGSKTYPRPRSAYRGRGGGSYRPSFEGRRGSRYDNEDEEPNFLKRPPPKTTLMDFMSVALKLNDTSSSDMIKQDDGENFKTKERNEGRRRHNNNNNTNDQYYSSTNKNGNGTTTTNLSLTTSPNHHHQQQFYSSSHKSLSSSLNNNNYLSSATIYGEQSQQQQQDGNYQAMNASNEQLDGDDDPNHSIYRERRNPLPPRLQRVQEERSRRNTSRYYDDTGSLSGSEMNGVYRNGTSNTHSLSSTTSFYRRGDPTSYITNPTVTGPHTNLNAYAQPHANMYPSINGSTPTHLAYFQTNPGTLTYMAGIPSPPFQQQPLPPSFCNDHVTYCYGPAYPATSYLPPQPPPIANGFGSGDSKGFMNNPPPPPPVSSFVDETETATTGSQQDDNDTEIQPMQSSSSSGGEQKPITTSPPSSSSETSSSISQPVTNEQHEEKRRDSTNSTRSPRWRVGDMCLARWSEDGEFYCATIVQIQPPFCLVLFRDYNNYDQVHFGNLKILPRDQQFYQFISSAPVPPATSDLTALTAAAAYFQPRTSYFHGTADGCILMPEAPPFPFNSAGTLFMYPSAPPRSTRSTSQQQQQIRRIENGNNNNLSSSSMSSSSINNNTTLSSSVTPPSKDDSDTSAIDDNQQDIQSTVPNSICSIADAPLSLVTDDDKRERSTSTESIPSSKVEDQQSTKEEEDEIEEEDSVAHA